MPGHQKNNSEESSASSSDLQPSATCALCSEKANSRCGGCNKVSYCSREHQKKHWKIHKGECCSWKICESPQLGRYLVAIRDIKAGEIIMRERPILLTPPKVTPPVCLGCYREFNLEYEERFQSKLQTRIRSLMLS